MMSTVQSNTQENECHSLVLFALVSFVIKGLHSKLVGAASWLVQKATLEVLPPPFGFGFHSKPIHALSFVTI